VKKKKHQSQPRKYLFLAHSEEKKAASLPFKHLMTSAILHLMNAFFQAEKKSRGLNFFLFYPKKK